MSGTTEIRTTGCGVNSQADIYGTIATDNAILIALFVALIKNLKPSNNGKVGK